MPTTTLNVDTRHTFLAAFFAQCGTRSGLKLYSNPIACRLVLRFSVLVFLLLCRNFSVSCRITRVTVKGSPETYSTSAVMLLLCLFMSFFFLVHAVSFDRQYNRTFKNLTRIHWHTCVLLPTNTGSCTFKSNYLKG
jgi:succinate dehydrogenase hydrophobic anchor subunit